MSIGIIGHTGFVGSHLYSFYPTAKVFHSKTIDTIKNQEFDLLFCAGISAKKWFANLHPEEDKQSILDLQTHLSTVKAKRCIVISTIDIYNIQIEKLQDENNICLTKEPYGLHRYEFEEWCKHHFKQTSIIRLPALFGFGLRKNLLYDYLFQGRCTLNTKSQFQWYDMQWLKQDIQYVLRENIATVNFFTEPIPNVELLSLLDLTRIDSHPTIQTYNIRTSYGGYWYSKKSVLAALERYIQSISHSNLIVSNLALHPLPEWISSFGIQKQEVVPFKTFGPDFIDQPLSFFHGKSVYSMQSLFYPNQWTLANDYDKICSYLKKLIDIAEVIGCKILVFGSPYLRSHGSFKLKSLLLLLDNYIHSRDITICLEPNAHYYQCSFLTSCEETHSFVHDLQCKHISWMFDIGNMMLEQENLQECLMRFSNEIKHVHFSKKDLRYLSNDIPWGWIQYQLKRYGYNGYITLEMIHVDEMELKWSLFAVTNTMPIEIIGCGWYGAHIASVALEKGYPIIVYEKNSVFHNVSSHNQNRLHEGYHYPRSYKTRLLCKQNYLRFLKTYGNCVSCIDDNLYFVSNDSILDFQTYKQIMQTENLSFEQVENKWLTHTGPSCFRVKEGIINFQMAKHMFETELKRFIRYESYPTNAHPSGLVLDCSYNELHHIHDAKFESSLYFIYRKKNNNESFAFTVMDGPFFSLYPYDLTKGLYTLTHVRFGRMLNESNITTLRTWMEEDVMKYYASFLDEFEHVNHHIAKKHVMTSTCASRELQIHETNQMISVACGKITGIFAWEDFLHL